jgi:hypothetical protein
MVSSQSLVVNSDLNQAVKWILRRGRPKEFSFSCETPIFNQPDMDESDIFIDTNEKICLIDFEDVYI